MAAGEQKGPLGLGGPCAVPPSLVTTTTEEEEPLSKAPEPQQPGVLGSLQGLMGSGRLGLIAKLLPE